MLPFVYSVTEVLEIILKVSCRFSIILKLLLCKLDGRGSVQILVAFSLKSALGPTRLMSGQYRRLFPWEIYITFVLLL
jgi:hypothetical protein